MFEMKNLRGVVAAPSGEEFYVTIRNPNFGIQTSIHLVTNWFPELMRLAPANNELTPI